MIDNGKEDRDCDHDGHLKMSSAVDIPASNQNLVIYVPVHYDLSQIEYVAPFLSRYPGSKVFIYKWNGIYDEMRQHYESDEYKPYRLGVFDFTLDQLVHAVMSEDPRKQIVFLLTSSTAYLFGQYQRQLLSSLKNILPANRIWGLTTVGHCMYGCSSCKGNDHKVPVYFTRYFRKELPYTADSLLQEYLPPNRLASTIPILVAPSTGTTSLILNRDMLDFMLQLQQDQKYFFVFKLHPACFNLADYDLTVPAEKTEFENVHFILKHFTYASLKQPCLLPFYEAFENILCDLHSSVGFMASYFAPRCMIAYHNDTGYEVPDRDPAFLANLNIFDDFEGLKRILLAPEGLPLPRGSPEFFYRMYGQVDGQEIERFSRLASWPTSVNTPPASKSTAASYKMDPSWRQWTSKVADQWCLILKEAILRQRTTPLEDEDAIHECKLAIGLSKTQSIREEELSHYVPTELSGPVPNDMPQPGTVSVRIMTYNMWHGGQAHPSHFSLQRVAQLILDSKADVCGLQETTGLPDADGRRQNLLGLLVDELNRLDKQPWYGLDQGLIDTKPFVQIPWGIVSRWPFDKVSPKKWGVRLRVPQTPVAFWLFNAHLTYKPYQPYQLCGIPYEGAPLLLTEKEAIQSAEESRWSQVQSLVAEIKLMDQEEQEHKLPLFLTGDFNEPSHQDWTAKSMVAGYHPIACAWPSTTAVVSELGMKDTFRSAYPDEVAFPGWTWTTRKDLEIEATRERDREHHDRIDFVFLRSPPEQRNQAKVLSAETIGARLSLHGKTDMDQGVLQAALVSDPSEWPTDHRAVLTTVELSP